MKTFHVERVEGYCNKMLNNKWTIGFVMIMSLFYDMKAHKINMDVVNKCHTKINSEKDHLVIQGRVSWRTSK